MHQTGTADLGMVEQQPPEVGQPRQVCQPGIGHGRTVKVQLLESAEMPDLDQFRMPLPMLVPKDSNQQQRSNSDGKGP